MKASQSPPFASRVASGMRRKGLTLRRFCRDAGIDPSFFSKVLSGKRSPPAEEAVLRRIADLLGLDAAELIVAAGRIPSEWRALWADPELFREIHELATRAVPARAVPAAAPSQTGRAEGPARAVPAAAPSSMQGADPRRRELSEELL